MHVGWSTVLSSIEGYELTSAPLLVGCGPAGIADLRSLCQCIGVAIRYMFVLASFCRRVEAVVSRELCKAPCATASNSCAMPRQKTVTAERLSLFVGKVKYQVLC